MASSTFYNDIEVKGIVKTSLAGKLIGTVTEMPAASSRNSGCAVLYEGASGTYVPGTIYLSNGSSWVAPGKTVTIVHGTSLSVSWAAATTVSGYSYKGTISLSGVTSNHIPTVTFDTAQARSGNYSPVAESGSNAVYIWSKTNTAITIPSVTAVLP